MKKTILLTIIVVFTFLSFIVVAKAQDDMQAKKYDNPKWTRIEMIKFKEGKAARGNEIIKNYFLAACQKSNTPAPALIDIITGDWDLLAIWNMEGGIEEMNWVTSPNDIKWMKAISDIAGSADKAKSIIDEFSSIIDRKTSYIGRSANAKL
jgi:hypothetical protein